MKQLTQKSLLKQSAFCWSMQRIQLEPVAKSAWGYFSTSCKFPVRISMEINGLMERYV